MQTMNIVLLIAYFIDLDFGFASFFNVITENQTEPSFQTFHLYHILEHKHFFLQALM